MKKVILLLGMLAGGLFMPVKSLAMDWGNLSDPAYAAWVSMYMDQEWYYTHVSGAGDPMMKVLGYYEDEEITFYSDIYVGANGYWYQTWGWDDGTYCTIYLGTDGNAYLRGNNNWYMYSA